MATYRVRTGDNPFRVATKFGVSPQKLLQTNGIKSLTTGQTINIPSNVGGGANRSVGYGYTAPVPSMTVNPYTGSNTYGPGLPPPPSPVNSGFQTPPTSGFMSPRPANQNALALGANTFIPQNTGIPQNTTINQNYIPPSNNVATNTVLPAGYVYTGGNSPEAIAQRQIWNMQAGASPERALQLAQNPPIRLTRDQIWNMKAQQRRRQQAQEAPVAAPVVSPVTGNAVNTSMSWRIG